MSKKAGKAAAPPAPVDVKGKKRAPDAAAAAGAAAAKVKKPEKIKLRRVHVSGLPVGLSEEDVKNRFKSFGQVKSVDNLGKLDGNGYPLRYAFLDIETTKSKLAQCMNLLSGSVWKGSTLRIAEAKPTYMERLARERQSEADKMQATRIEEPTHGGSASVPADKPAGSTKRKRAEGSESTHQQLVDAETAKARDGWKVDPQSGTPIFPIVARPDHPLPPLPEASSSSKAGKVPKSVSKVDKSDKKALAKEKKKEKKARAAAEAVATAEPPHRAHRVKIDPTKWKPTHLREGDMPEQGALDIKPSVEESASDGAISSDEDESISVPHPVESKANLAAIDTEHSDSSESEESAEDSLGNLNASTAVSENIGMTERKAQMDLLASMLGRVPERVEAIADASLRPSESSSEDEDGDNDDASDVDAGRTQSVAAQRVEERDQATQGDTVAAAIRNEGMEDGTSGESSDTDESEAMAEETVAAQPAIQMHSLTEMFKPQEAGSGFMLGDLLDEGEFDLEDLPEEPSAPVSLPSFRPQANAAPTQARTAVHRAGAYDPHEQLFFPFPIEEDELPGGVAYNLTESQRAALLERSWTGVSEFKRFKRTQNMDEITAQYEVARKTLTEQVRKRHREAVKTRKRNGGKRSQGFLAQEDD